MSAMNNPVVILDNIQLDLTDDVIAEITTGMRPVDGLILETAAATTPSAATPAGATPAAATPAAVPAAAANDEYWLHAAGPSSRSLGVRAGPSRTPGATPHHSSGRKNMKALLRSLRSPSPTLSIISSQSSAADEEDSDEFTKFLEEEQRRRAMEEQRRAEWSRRAAGRRAEMESSLRKARDLVSSLTGEGKHLKTQREALRAQLRALDEQEVTLEKKKRSAVKSVRKYEIIVAKYKEMNI